MLRSNTYTDPARAIVTPAESIAESLLQPTNNWAPLVAVARLMPNCEPLAMPGTEIVSQYCQ